MRLPTQLEVLLQSAETPEQRYETLGRAACLSRTALDDAPAVLALLEDVAQLHAKPAGVPGYDANSLEADQVARMFDRGYLSEYGLVLARTWPGQRDFVPAPPSRALPARLWRRWMAAVARLKTRGGLN